MWRDSPKFQGDLISDLKVYSELVLLRFRADEKRMSSSHPIESRPKFLPNRDTFNLMNFTYETSPPAFLRRISVDAESDQHAKPKNTTEKTTY